MTKIELGPAWSYIKECETYEMTIMDRVASFKVPGAYFVPAYSEGHWDGRIHLIKSGGRFPTGIWPNIKEVLDTNKIVYRVDDQREIPDFSGWEDRFSGLDIQLRDYQMEAVAAGMSHSLGIINSPIGSGKTVIMGTLIRVADKRTLVLTNRKEMLYQLSGFIHSRFGTKCTLVGDGHKDYTGKTVVALVQAVPKYRSTNEGRAFHKYLETVEYIVGDECLGEDTNIYIPGGMKRLKDIVLGDTVCTPTGTAKVINKWETEKDAYEVVMRSGNKLVMSSDHLVLSQTNVGYNPKKYETKKVSDCDNMIFFRSEDIGKPVFDYEEYLVGLFLGDGHLESKSIMKFAYGKNREIWMKRFNEIGEKLGCVPNSFMNKRGNLVISFPTDFSQRLAKKYNLISGKKSNDLVIPQQLFDPRRGGVIKGLYDSDGWSVWRRIAIDLTSPECILQMSCLLKRLGIRTNVKRYKASKIGCADRNRLAVFGVDQKRLIETYDIKLKRNCNFDYNENIRSGKYISDKIESINYIGKQKLIDIEIDDNEKLFLADGYVVHNCHHTSADSWYKIIMGCTSAVLRHGYTATAFRADGKDLLLNAATGPVIFRLTTSDVIKKGNLSRPHINLIEIDRPVIRGGSFGEIERRAIVENDYRNDIISQFVRRIYEAGKTCLVMVDMIDHGERLAKLVSGFAHEKDWAYMTGREPTAIRQQCLTDIRSGSRRIVICTPIWQEGVDIPSLDAGVNAAGGDSEIGTIQKLGRIVRKKDSLSTEGESVIYLDFIDKTNKYLVRHSNHRCKYYESEPEYRVYRSKVLDKIGGLDVGT